MKKIIYVSEKIQNHEVITTFFLSSHIVETKRVQQMRDKLGGLVDTMSDEQLMKVWQLPSNFLNKFMQRKEVHNFICAKLRFFPFCLFLTI